MTKKASSAPPDQPPAAKTTENPPFAGSLSHCGVECSGEAANSGTVPASTQSSLDQAKHRAHQLQARQIDKLTNQVDKADRKPVALPQAIRETLTPKQIKAIESRANGADETAAMLSAGYSRTVISSSKRAFWDAPKIGAALQWCADELESRDRVDREWIETQARELYLEARTAGSTSNAIKVLELLAKLHPTPTGPVKHIHEGTIRHAYEGAAAAGKPSLDDRRNGLPAGLTLDHQPEPRAQNKH